MSVTRHHQPRSASGRALGVPRLTSVATALPRHQVDQNDAKRFATGLFSSAFGDARRRLLEVFDHSGVESRRVCMPLEWYETPHGLAETNALYLEQGLELAREAAAGALARAGLSAREIDHIVFVSSTGIATPSLDARIANRMGMGLHVRRTPIWGLGCAGGAAGLSRAADLARADPEARVLLVTLELCSLTFQRADLDRRNLVAASLFSDGAAAAVVCGAGRAQGNGSGPGRVEEARSGAARDRPAAPPGAGSDHAIALEILATRSTLWPETLDVMGWTVDALGLHVVFSRDIPTIVRRWVRPDMESFLAAHDLELPALDFVIAHPGGPKVLAAYAECLGLPLEAFRHAREVLRTCGNMSSPTCLFVLEHAHAAGDLPRGGLGVVAALGPGFSSEYLLVRAR